MSARLGLFVDVPRRVEPRHILERYPAACAMRLGALLFLLASAASAQSFDAEAPPLTLLVVTEAEGLGLGDVLERGELVWAPADVLEIAGPHGRATWRGAKTGALVGLGIGVVATIGAMVYESQVGCDYICLWHITAVGTVPLTLATSVAGAGIGWAGSHLRPIELRDDG